MGINRRWTRSLASRAERACHCTRVYGPRESTRVCHVSVAHQSRARARAVQDGVAFRLRIGVTGGGWAGDRSRRSPTATKESCAGKGPQTRILKCAGLDFDAGRRDTDAASGPPPRRPSPHCPPVAVCVRHQSLSAVRHPEHAPGSLNGCARTRTSRGHPVAPCGAAVQMGLRWSPWRRWCCSSMGRSCPQSPTKEGPVWPIPGMPREARAAWVRARAVVRSGIAERGKPLDASLAAPAGRPRRWAALAGTATSTKTRCRGLRPLGPPSATASPGLGCRCLTVHYDRIQPLCCCHCHAYHSAVCGDTQNATLGTSTCTAGLERRQTGVSRSVFVSPEVLWECIFESWMENDGKRQYLSGFPEPKCSVIDSLFSAGGGGGHNRGTPNTGHRERTNGTRRNQHSPGTPPTALRERGNDTSGSTDRSGRQNAATRRNMRREERVTVQGPVKKQRPDGMSHGGGGWDLFAVLHSCAVRMVVVHDNDLQTAHFSAQRPARQRRQGTDVMRPSGDTQRAAAPVASHRIGTTSRSSALLALPPTCDGACCRRGMACGHGEGRGGRPRGFQAPPPPPPPFPALRAHAGFELGVSGLRAFFAFFPPGTKS